MSSFLEGHKAQRCHVSDAMNLLVLYVTMCTSANSFVTTMFKKWKQATSNCPLKLTYKPQLYFSSVF